MKEIFYSELGGSVATSALLTTIDAGKVLPQVQDLGAMVAAGVLIVDAFVEEHLGPVGQGIGNGAAAYAIGHLTKWAMEKTIPAFKKPAPVLIQYTGTGSNPATGTADLFNLSGAGFVSGDIGTVQSQSTGA